MEKAQDILTSLKDEADVYARASSGTVWSGRDFGYSGIISILCECMR
jgi:hypothetical protein